MIKKIILLVFFLALISPAHAQEDYLLRTIPAHLGMIFDIALNPQETLLLSAGEDQKVRIWSLPDWRLFKTISLHTAPVQAVAFSLDGNLAASGGADRVVYVYDALTWTTLATLELKSSAHSLAFSPNNQWLAIGEGGGNISIWNLNKYSRQKYLKGHTGIVQRVAFTQNGEWLLSVSRDGARLWSGYSWRERKDGILPVDSLYSLQVHGQSDQAIFGGITKRPQIWNTRRWQPSVSLTGHSGSIYSSAFSVDGRYVASGSSDKFIFLWDAYSGKLLRKLGAHDATVHALTFVNSKGWVVSAGADRMIKVWDAMRYYLQQNAELKNSSGEVLTVLAAGSAVTIEGEEEGKILVRLPSGASGYLLRSQVVFDRE